MTISLVVSGYLAGKLDEKLLWGAAGGSNNRLVDIERSFSE